MLNTNNPTGLKVLITRPENKAQQLAQSLARQGIACLNQPLFDYQALHNSAAQTKQLTDADMLIFVSAAAVEFANAYWPATHWQAQPIFAVGQATKQALQTLGIPQVISPEQENSEGLLTLALLKPPLTGKKITIVRGNGGREYLAEVLLRRGAKVSYLEVYQRVWRVLAQEISKQWYTQQINCIVVTSNAILEQLVTLLTVNKPSTTLAIATYWRQQCYWLTVSQRISERAKQLGVSKVITCNGASAPIISEALQSLKTDLSNPIQ